MPKIKIVELTAEQRASLEKGARYSPRPTFRLRCQAVLLKSQPGRSALSVADELGCCEMAVNNWVNRFLAGGVGGLTTRAGRGRRAVLQPTDLPAVGDASPPGRAWRTRKRLTLFMPTRAGCR
jgi:hypothetical protein